MSSRLAELVDVFIQAISDIPWPPFLNDRNEWIWAGIGSRQPALPPFLEQSIRSRDEIRTVSSHVVRFVWIYFQVEEHNVRIRAKTGMVGANG